MKNKGKNLAELSFASLNGVDNCAEISSSLVITTITVTGSPCHISHLLHIFL